MIDLSPELVTLIMFGSLFAFIFSGYPMGFLLIIIGAGVGFLLFGSSVFEIFRLRSYNLLTTFVFMAVPLFIFMGSMVERAGLGEKLYSTLYVLLGGFRGGLAIATILLGTILAACVGVIAASVVMMGLVALPSMLKREYDKSIACGAVCAGGSLGILIPPSIMLVVYGPTASISVGKLFMSAFPAGFLLSALYIIYLVIICSLKKNLAPPMAAQERSIPWSVKIRGIIGSLMPPLGLMLAVLGSIFFGIASPTEAAGIGALASILMTIGYRRLNLAVLTEVLLTTMRTTCMVIIVALGAAIFTGVFDAAGGTEVVSNAIMTAPFGKWGSFATIMLIVLILGMFIDWIGIVFIMVPIVNPLISELGFDPLWFAMMIIINLQMSFLTPPFATAIFFLRGIVKPDWGLTSMDIIRGVLPYVGLICIGLGLCVRFPQILLWLPSRMIE